MGFVFSGIIIKGSTSVDVDQLLQIVNRSSYHYIDDMPLERATINNFEGMAIARDGDSIVIFGNDIGYACSFENNLSAVDKNLLTFSKNADIICFVTNSIADTYAWSVFANGQRIRCKAIAEKKILFESGEETKYEKDMESGDQGVLTLIENFTGHAFNDLVFEKNIEAAVYRSTFM